MRTQKPLSHRRVAAPRGYAVMLSAASTRALAEAVSARKATTAAASRVSRMESELVHQRRASGYPRYDDGRGHGAAPSGYSVMPTIAPAMAVASLAHAEFAAHADTVETTMTEMDHPTVVTDHEQDQSFNDSTVSPAEVGADALTQPPSGYDVMPMTADPAELSPTPDVSSGVDTSTDLGMDAGQGMDTGL